MSKQMNIRLDNVHLELLEKTVEKLKNEGVNTNKTDVIEKAIYLFSKEFLGMEEVSKIIDEHYSGLYKGLDL